MIPAMKRLAPLAALLLGGCFLAGSGSHVAPPDPGLKVYRPHVAPVPDRHGSDRAHLAPAGSWARYRLTRDGVETLTTLGAVSSGDGFAWIEIVEEGEPRRASLRRIDSSGRVLAARCREVREDGTASEVAEQPVVPAGEPRAAREGVREERRGRGHVGPRLGEILEVTTTYRDEALGREYVETEAWCRDVPPLLEGSEEGGLVRRRAAGSLVELDDFGTGYVPVIRP